MNWLQWSLHTINRVFPFGPHRATPWRLVKCEVLIVKCQCSVRFLKACRRKRIIPHFVRNCSKVSKLFGNCFQSCEEKFHRMVLNRIIREKYRRLRLLQRECHTLKREIHSAMTAGAAKWTTGHSRWMSDFVRAEESRKLHHKLEKMLLEKGQVQDTSSSDKDRSGRVVVESTVSLPVEMRTLMELGPKFVPKQRITKSVLHKAEVAVERLAFGKRWQKVAEKAQEIQERDGHEDNQTEDNRPVRCLDEDVRLKKIATTTKQAPLMEVREENGLIRLKENILNIYNRARRKEATDLHGRELTRRERQSINELATDKSVVIKPSDKSKGFVVMSRNSYVQKVNAMLGDSENYESCQLKVEELDKMARSTIDRITSGKLPTALHNALLPSNSRMSRFYGLPKDHKQGLPLRPVVSSCGSPLSNVSLLLERILNQLLEFVPAHLSSTEECVKELRNLGRLPDNCIVASMDVAALYTNIPINESIDAAMEMLEEHRQSVDMFSLAIPDVRRLLEFVLNSNYFVFGEKVYRQRKGLAMGNNLAPPMAIIFMSKFEQEALAMTPWKPSLYKRYIDDCLVVWLHGLERLIEFIEFLNSRHPNIRLTSQHTLQDNGRSVSYLDLSVSVCSGYISWELFVKPSHSGVHLSYESALPETVKKSVAVEQFRRADRNANNVPGRQRGNEKIEDLLRTNNYPHEIIQAAKRRATLQRSERRRMEERSFVIKLPFINDQLAQQVRRTVRSFDRTVRVVFQAGQSLRDMLVSSLLDQEECPKVLSQRVKKRGRPKECRACDAGLTEGNCTRKGVIYTMQCSICEAEYVGETERCLRERFAEHHRQACAATTGTPWGSHYAAIHNTPQRDRSFRPFKRARILAMEQSHVNRRILEALFIRERQPMVNNDCGWKLMGM